LLLEAQSNFEQASAGMALGLFGWGDCFLAFTTLQPPLLEFQSNSEYSETRDIFSELFRDLKQRLGAGLPQHKFSLVPPGDTK